MAYTPRDKYNAVWLIFFMLGLGTLLPWNFFMTATAYFTSRLKDTTMENSRIEGFRDIQSTLEAKFNNVMTLCSMIPLLAFTCLNSFLHGLIPQKFRVMGSLIVILVVFLITAIIVKVDMEPIPFFSLTMIKIVIINSFGAILQGSLFGMAGLLPTKYTTPIMSGQGLAGTFAAFSMICAIASGSEIQDAAFGYFLTACAVIGLTIVCYAVLPRLEFYQFYQPSNIDRGPCDEESATDSTDPPKTDTGPVKEKTGTVEITIEPVETNTRPKVSMIAIFKKIWWLALSVCFTFTVTIGIFPAITADVKSTVANEGSWEVYFIPVSCFLLFNISDWIGRSLTAGCMFPGKDSILLPILVVSRVAFIPLFMLCNVQPRYNLPVIFHHDAWFIVFMIVFAFSNGYMASLCMCFGPRKVLPHEAETAGAIMAFFLSLGLGFGAALSFLFRAVI